jgi:iron complex outermembrane receptor protein
MGISVGSRAAQAYLRSGVAPLSIAIILVSASTAGAQSAPAGAPQAEQGAPAPLAPQADPQTAATQTSATPSAESAEGAEASTSDIVVTGSRIKRNGYQSPTPETVIAAADINAAAPANIADYVNDLPQLAGSSTPRSAPSNLSSGTAGSNFLNLRGLGASRTLVLLDGRRVVGSSVEGLVDANTLPASLISRIDVVTGGASAAYGSDAVAGVINFVLDTKFNGLKLEAQTGVTGYGDDYRYKLDGAAGFSFAGGRGHVLAAATYSKNDGVLQAQSRPWFNGAKIIANPAYSATNGQPRLIQANNVNTANASFGGLITSGALAGTQFNDGGAISQRQFGTPAGAMYTIGGEQQDMAAYQTLDIPLEQTTAFGRVSFNLTDGIELFGEFNYGKAVARNLSIFNWQFGNLTLQRDNAYLPVNLRAQLVDAGQTNFRFGTLNGDIGQAEVRNGRELTRFVGGLNADLGSGWRAEGYGQYGKTKIDTAVGNLQNRANYTRAIDAVVNPANGAIVCRSSLAAPGNGCVPFNLFGTGVNSQAALDYVTGTSQLRLDVEQTVFSGTIQGDPFSTWAGAVSLIVGAEYRKEQVSGSSDAISQANGYYAGNYKPTNGDYDVKEIFAETIVPLARELPFLYSLDVNAAVRYTDYSTSGGVTTWKVGGTWNPIHDVRLRITRSRDIRAPNLNDLFLGGVTSVGQTVIDRGASVGGITATTIGNLAVTPEKADTLTAGIVYTPSWLEGFSASVDFYNVKINDAILTLSTQQVVDRCSGGNQIFCALITRDAVGTITSLTRTPINLATEKARGIDIEASYTREIATDTRVTLRGLGTYVDSRSLFDGFSTDRLDGENSVNPPGGSIPKWRVIGSLGLQSGPVSGVFTGRYVSPGKYDNAYTEADLADNRIAGATYFDLSTTIKFPAHSGDGEFFINIDNVFNKDPVIVAPVNQPFFNAPVNPLLYDTLGREFRMGVRFKF